LLAEGGCELLFAPSSVEELYPNGYRTFVTLNGIENTLEGRSRPGHFRGPFFKVKNPRSFYRKVQGILIARFRSSCLFLNIRSYFGQYNFQEVNMSRENLNWFVN
jgi:hypothetical protein